ncbi:AbrB/MazE/SpoVT family DNA-binding domain-containing protein [Candidatus Woesearchaeota archaeon]|nr:AbrB/MazE/SpoVT family DNA-binding domain-containing protein [Candidatus Woesearchaeota archaeon]
MVMAEARVKQWGNSIGIIIPRDVAKIEDVHAGDLIKVDISKEKRVDAFGIIKGAPKFVEEDIMHEDF